MTQANTDPRDPKKLPDSVSGVESNDQVTNSEDQQIVDDIVAETYVSSDKQPEEEQTVTENEKRDITGIN